MRPLHIGILNIMHDKADTNARFNRVLRLAGLPIVPHFYYPVSHYAGRAVPSAVSAILAPLRIDEAAALDAFIITGAPVEQFAFADVTYIAEVNALLDALAAGGREQLYLCWGGMAALAHQYGIAKHMLPHKLFGVYPHEQLAASDLLTGLPAGFMAPHARYAEMDRAQVQATSALTLVSETPTHHLFLVENAAAHQTFMFAHLEYGPMGLAHEYQREVAAHPERHYRRPEQAFADPAHFGGPVFNWADTQATFFSQWVRRVAANRLSSTN